MTHTKDIDNEYIRKHMGENDMVLAEHFHTCRSVIFRRKKDILQCDKLARQIQRMLAQCDPGASQQ